MNYKVQIIIGFIIGLVMAYIGAYLYVTLFTEYDFNEGLTIIKSQNNLGKLISLGAIPNLILFFVFLKLKREMFARGVVLATILLALITAFYL